MLKLLIPVMNARGAVEAARHGVFLFAERCASDVEIVEVLDEAEQGRAAAFHSWANVRERDKQVMRDALMQTCAVFDDAGVPCTFLWEHTAVSAIVRQHL